jgi:hypothetical protein
MRLCYNLYEVLNVCESNRQEEKRKEKKLSVKKITEREKEN